MQRIVRSDFLYILNIYRFYSKEQNSKFCENLIERKFWLHCCVLCYQLIHMALTSQFLAIFIPNRWIHGYAFLGRYNTEGTLTLVVSMEELMLNLSFSREHLSVVDTLISSKHCARKYFRVFLPEFYVNSSIRQYLLLVFDMQHKI